MVPFHSFTARSVQGRPAEEWLEGRLLVWLDMFLPRDQDLLQQLMARSTVVSEALQAKRDSRRVAAWADEQPREVDDDRGRHCRGVSCTYRWVRAGSQDGYTAS